MALKEILAVFGVEFDATELEKGNKKVDSATDKLKNLVKVAAASTAVVALKSFIGELQATAEATSKNARDLKMQAQQYQALEFAASKARVEMSDISGAITTLNDKVRLSLRPGIYYIDQFKRLGVAVRDTSGKTRSSADILEDVAAKISRIKGEHRQAAFAVRMFGDAGKKILPFLRQGAEGMKKAREEIALLGGGLTDKSIEQLKELTDAQQRWGVATTSLKVTLATALLPTLTIFINKISYGAGKLVEFLRPIVEAIKQSSLLQAVFVMLGVAGLAKVLSLVGGFTKLLAVLRAASLTMLKLLLPLLLIDEIITTFRGGDTLIRRAIDGMFGEGTTKKVTDFFVNAYNEAKKFFDRFPNLVKEAWEFFKRDTEELRAAIVEAWERAKKAIDDFVTGAEDAWTSIKAGVDEIIAKFNEWGEALQKFWDKYGAPILFAVETALVAIALKSAAASAALILAATRAAAAWLSSLLPAIARVSVSFAIATGKMVLGWGATASAAYSAGAAAGKGFLPATLAAVRSALVAIGTTVVGWMASGAAAVAAGLAAAAAWLPFIAAAAVIVGVIWGIIYVWKNWEQISSDFAYFFKDVWGGVADWFGGVWDGIKNKVSEVVDWASGKLEALAKKLAKLPLVGDLFGGDDKNSGAPAIAGAAAAPVASAPAGRGATKTVSVSAPTENHIQVTVPPGTPASVAQEIGQRTGAVFSRQAATRAAVVQRAGS